VLYTRFVSNTAPQESVGVTVDHVRAHLSSVADADDDPTTRAEDVEVHIEPAAGGVLVVGHLDAEPEAAYLKLGFDPYDGVPAELRALAADDEVTA
jgi:hypothetical protein